MKRTSISYRLIAVCAACAFIASSCAQSAQMGMTEGRARANVEALVGLISAIVGGLAIRSGGRTGGMVALVLGLIAAIFGAMHIAASTGFGTGGGKAGAIIAVVLALIGIILGGLTLFRSSRSGTTE
jgi:hypothetical protein